MTTDSIASENKTECVYHQCHIYKRRKPVPVDVAPEEYFFFKIQRDPGRLKRSTPSLFQLRKSSRTTKCDDGRTENMTAIYTPLKAGV